MMSEALSNTLLRVLGIAERHESVGNYRHFGLKDKAAECRRTDLLSSCSHTTSEYGKAARASNDPRDEGLTVCYSQAYLVRCARRSHVTSANAGGHALTASRVIDVS